MSEARSFLEHHTAEVEIFDADYNLKYWTASLSGRSGDAAASAGAKEKLLQVYARPDEFAEVRRLAALPGHDAATARQLHLLTLAYGARQMDAAVLADLVRREEEIEAVFNSFRAQLDGDRVTENDLRGILREATDPARRRAAWEASKQVGAEVSGRLLELVRIRNREARRLGHRDYYAMSLQLQEMEETALFGLLDRLGRLSEEPFRRMKAGLDRTLASRYGLDSFTPWPWMYADPFFQEAPPGAADVDLDAVFASRNVEALTRRTYQGLQLPVDELFERSDLYEKEGKCQHAFCTHIDRRGDIRVLGNIKPDEYWMSAMLHEFGHAVYERHLDPALPFLLRTPAHLLTTEAVAMLMGRQTRNADWLSRVAGVPETEARKLEEGTRRSLRISQLIFVRWGLLLTHFERELYREPEQDLDGLWWEMAARFQGLAPPPDPAGGGWASKIHLSSAPVYYHNYVLGELMASQLQHAIFARLADGTSRPSFVDQPAAGEFLRERLFRPGGRRDWQGAITGATGEPLNPDYFLQQFVRET